MANLQSASQSTPSDMAVPLTLKSATDTTHGPGSRSEWILLHVGFIATGIVTTLIGNVLPSFIRHWSLRDSQAGFLIAAQFTGSLLGTLLTSVLLPRYGFARVLGAGFFAFAMGFVFLGVGPWLLAAVCVFVYGFGYGLANPATNLRGTQLPSRNMASTVSLLNFSWTVGAVSCPFVVAQLLPAIGIRGIALCLVVVSLIIAACHFFRHAASPEPRSERSTHSLSEWMQRLGQAPSVSLFLIFFLYVGTEVGIGSWVATQERRLGGTSVMVLFLAPSFFYGFLLLGRSVSTLLLRRVSTISLSLAGLVSVSFGAVVITLAQRQGWLYAGAAVAGLGCAPQYPIFVTWMAQTFRKNATWLSALFFGAAGAGGAVLPWLMGILAARTHSLRLGFLLPFAASVFMMVFAMRSHPHAESA
ncbi:MAG TPA: MFS transporter [Candidatus Sulfotelmatobacter sp.]|nr:MFS transporter [Candidatus Sulfotelmatobacter sp.]